MALIYVVEDDKNIQEIETFALSGSGYQTVGFDNAVQGCSKWNGFGNRDLYEQNKSRKKY